MGLLFGIALDCIWNNIQNCKVENRKDKMKTRLLIIIRIDLLGISMPTLLR